MFASVSARGPCAQAIIRRRGSHWHHQLTPQTTTKQQQSSSPPPPPAAPARLSCTPRHPSHPSTMRRILALLLVALLAGSALAETRRARYGRRRRLLGSGPACEAMPPRGGPTNSVNCGSQCTASTQQYMACCDRMFDLFIVGEWVACLLPLWATLHAGLDCRLSSGTARAVSSAAKLCLHPWWPTTQPACLPACCRPILPRPAACALRHAGGRRPV